MPGRLGSVNARAAWSLPRAEYPHNGQAADATRGQAKGFSVSLEIHGARMRGTGDVPPEGRLQAGRENGVPAVSGYPVAFAGLRSGQPLVLRVGDETQGSLLSARVTSVTDSSIRLALNVLPHNDLALSPGAFVQLVRPPHGHLEGAVVESFETDPEPVVALVPASEHEAGGGHAARRYLVRQKRGGLRRDYQRLSFAEPMPIFVSVVRPEGPLRLRVELLDVSAGGARLRTPRTLQPRLSLIAHLPSLPGFAGQDAQGRVAWVTSRDGATVFGVQFLGLDDATRDALERLVFRLRWMGKD